MVEEFQGEGQGLGIGNRCLIDARPKVSPHTETSQGRAQCLHITIRHAISSAAVWERHQRGRRGERSKVDEVKGPKSKG